jgi:hypothetical protein
VDPGADVSPQPVRGGAAQGNGPGDGSRPAHGGGPAHGGSPYGGGGARHAAGRVTASLPPAELFGPPPAGDPGAGLSGSELPADFSAAADLPAAEPGGW